MGELVVNTPSGDLTFTITGDQPPVSAAIKIKNIIPVNSLGFILKMLQQQVMMIVNIDLRCHINMLS